MTMGVDNMYRSLDPSYFTELTKIRLPGMDGASLYEYDFFKDIRSLLMM